MTQTKTSRKETVCGRCGNPGHNARNKECYLKHNPTSNPKPDSESKSKPEPKKKQQLSEKLKTYLTSRSKTKKLKVFNPNVCQLHHESRTIRCKDCKKVHRQDFYILENEEKQEILDCWVFSEPCTPLTDTPKPAPEPTIEPTPKEENKQKRKCSVCRETGHTKRHCPLK